MVRLFIQVMVTGALLACSYYNQLATAAFAGQPVHTQIAGKEFGDKYGGQFDYRFSKNFGDILKGVTISTGKRVDSIGVIFQTPQHKQVKYSYGGDGGNLQTLMLQQRERITGIEAHSTVKDGRKRISFIKISTNLNRSIQGGTKTDDVDKEDAENGFQLMGFYGRRGDEVNSVGALWQHAG
ncbi:hypothetical protein CCR75_005571 [Bremia lactucae]|uniref:Jacalin-type lectin domain-containing protein n=1 Tax=Bremia lactucae TaxID=4779 RepID=A0A976FQM3_BRELC|nr:hypothetical protein CCR75_005571 [Bremia lactucae]